MSRVKCPKCGNNNPRHIKELDDLKKPLYQLGALKIMYAKKYHCNDCRFVWEK